MPVGLAGLNKNKIVLRAVLAAVGISSYYHITNLVFFYNSI